MPANDRRLADQLILQARNDARIIGQLRELRAAANNANDDNDAFINFAIAFDEGYSRIDGESEVVAKELLERFLTPSQRDSLRDIGGFLVVGSNGHHYWLTNKMSNHGGIHYPRLVRLEPDYLRVGHSFCIHPGGIGSALPYSDRALSHKMAIEDNAPAWEIISYPSSYDLDDIPLTPEQHALVQRQIDEQPRIYPHAGHGIEFVSSADRQRLQTEAMLRANNLFHPARLVQYERAPAPVPVPEPPRPANKASTAIGVTLLIASGVASFGGLALNEPLLSGLSLAAIGLNVLRTAAR